MGSASSIADMVRRSGLSAARLLLCFVSVRAAASCLYHSSDRCDPGQNYDDSAGLCVCDAKANLVAGDHGCVACGEHEVAANDACSCEDGYARPSSGAACALLPPALGKACDSDTDCSDATYDTCHAVTRGASYCTNTGCDQDPSRCTSGYACATTDTPSYCERPPAGAGKTCAADSDCAGTEATYCESFTTHVCDVEGCSLTKNDCFPGKECCDLSAFSQGTINKQICLDSGTCPK